jgi:hypothetical protein
MSARRSRHHHGQQPGLTSTNTDPTPKFLKPQALTGTPGVESSHEFLRRHIPDRIPA